MKKFSDFLAELETTDQIQKVELMNAAGEIVGLIENKPGSQGSVRVFNHLFKKVNINLKNCETVKNYTGSINEQNGQYLKIFYRCFRSTDAWSRRRI